MKRHMFQVLFLASFAFFPLHVLSQHRGVVVGAGYIVDRTMNKIDRLEEGDTIIAISLANNEYTKVLYNGNKVGLLRTSNISWDLNFYHKIENNLKADSTSTDTTLVVISTAKALGVPIRDKPDIDGNEISYCRDGEFVKLLEYKGGNYYKIKYAHVIGYINISSLKHSRAAVDTVNSFFRNGYHRLEYQPRPREQFVSQQHQQNTAPTKTYHTGPRGGVYSINSNGKKVYKKKN
jgi:hypothetical protein